MTDRARIALVRRHAAGGPVNDHDLVATEAALALRVRHADASHPHPLGILMRTPGDDVELVTGFLYGEDMVRHATDVLSIDLQSGDGRTSTDVADVVLAGHVAWSPSETSRAAMQTSACGLCGRLALLAADRGRACPAGGPTLPIDRLQKLPERLSESQAVFRETGGLHAAALFEPSGELLTVREDIGRHNAVDKVIGWAVAAGWIPAQHLVLVVSGRVAYEIVQKAVMAGMAAVVAVGAPSDLAVEAARAASLTLVGFAREGRCNVYAGWERLEDVARRGGE